MTTVLTALCCGRMTKMSMHLSNYATDAKGWAYWTPKVPIFLSLSNFSFVILINPFLTIMTTVHCHSLHYVEGDWHKNHKAPLQLVPTLTMAKAEHIGRHRCLHLRVYQFSIMYFLNPFLIIVTTVHCRSLRYVAGDWQKSLWELCFLSGAQCNKGLNTDDYTKMHLNRNSSNVSVALNYLKEILII